MKKLLLFINRRCSQCISLLFLVAITFCISARIEKEITFTIHSEYQENDLKKLTKEAMVQNIQLLFEEEENAQLHIRLQNGLCTSEFVTEKNFHKIDIKVKKGSCSVNFNVLQNEVIPSV